jgi:hypothetical protein
MNQLNAKQPAMRILQISPAAGWYAECAIDPSDGSRTTVYWDVACWALVEEDGKTRLEGLDGNGLMLREEEGFARFVTRTGVKPGVNPGGTPPLAPGRKLTRSSPARG